jgi:hypothetical protein
LQELEAAVVALELVSGAVALDVTAGVTDRVMTRKVEQALRQRQGRQTPEAVAAVVMIQASLVKLAVLAL